MLVREGGQGEGKAKLCYTVFALSDLAVSGSLPVQWQLAFYRYFPKPLQRSHWSFLLGDCALDLVLVRQVLKSSFLEWNGARSRMSGARPAMSRLAYK